MELPDKKYSIIYADPPWKYWSTGKKNQSRHYNCLTIDEICTLPINKITDDDCILFIWVTYPILQKSFEVIERWGFKYSTCGFSWVKKNKKSTTWFWGLGSWTRSNNEICLLATKGKPKRVSKSVHQIVDDRIREHSRKPDCVRDRIVELCGDLPRIELFARNKTPGWDVWGNEV
tara:strand:+ start:39 stop:563 length:525 start_codon:yes stop_codon:yes gene_type:complete